MRCRFMGGVSVQTEEPVIVPGSVHADLSEYPNRVMQQAQGWWSPERRSGERLPWDGPVHHLLREVGLFPLPRDFGQPWAVLHNPVGGPEQGSERSRPECCNPLFTCDQNLAKKVHQQRPDPLHPDGINIGNVVDRRGLSPTGSWNAIAQIG